MTKKSKVGAGLAPVQRESKIQVKSFKFLIALFTFDFILLTSLSGCVPIAVSEEQKKKILAVDSDFGTALELKSQLDAQLSDLRVNFSSEKNIYESKITALRKEFEVKKSQFYTQTYQIKGKLDQYREKLKLDIPAVTEELRNKYKNLKAVKAVFSQAKTALEPANSASLSAEEKARWQKSFDELSMELRKANEEIALIKEKLSILKLKQRSLIQ